MTRVQETTGQPGLVLTSLEGDDVLLGAVGALYATGHSVDWASVWPAPASGPRLPRYPWQRRRCWLPASFSRQPITGTELLPSPTEERPSPARPAAPARPATSGLSPFISSQAERLQAIAQLPAKQQRTRLTSLLQEEVARILELEPRSLPDTRKGFLTLGMSSREAVTLQQRAEQLLGRRLPATLAFDYPTIEALAGYIQELVKADGLPPAPPRPSPRELLAQALDSLEQLSNEEAERLLAQSQRRQD
jgi:acyl transferase domain-containing protein